MLQVTCSSLDLWGAVERRGKQCSHNVSDCLAMESGSRKLVANLSWIICSIIILKLLLLSLLLLYYYYEICGKIGLPPDFSYILLIVIDPRVLYLSIRTINGPYWREQAKWSRCPEIYLLGILYFCGDSWFYAILSQRLDS